MKKALSILLVAAMILALFVGCGSENAPAATGSGDQRATEKAPSSAEKPELRIAIWGDEARAAAYRCC